MPSSLRNHDLGDDHVLIHLTWDAGSLHKYSELFPDQDPIQTCDYERAPVGVPAFAPFTNADWFTLIATTTEDFRASVQDHALRPTDSRVTGALPSGPSETGMNGGPDNTWLLPPTATSSSTAASSAGCWKQVRINSHYQAAFFFGFVISWNLWKA